MPLYRYIDIPKKTHFFCPFARRILRRGNGTGASALKTHRSVGKAQINLALLSFFRNFDRQKWERMKIPQFRSN